MRRWSPDVEAHALALAERLLEDSKPRRRPEAVDGEGDPRWHVVHCTGRSDRQVVDFLGERKIETYHPMMRELRRVPRRELSRKQRASGLAIMRPQLVALLPRYIFVRFDMGRPGWREIFAFAGIGGLVCDGGLPVRVPDAMVDGLRAREIDGAVPGKTPAALIFGLGETVRVKDGPLAGFKAIVEKLPDVALEAIDSDMRIVVAMHLFGQQTAVGLKLGQVEKL